MPVKQLLIVQPWLGEFGHPAQSLVNLALALGPRDDVDYLVSDNAGSALCATAQARLRQVGDVHTFAVETRSGDANTRRAIGALLKLRLQGRRYRRVLFFDSTLPAIARLWPLVAWLCRLERLGILHMFGPELIDRDPVVAQRVRALLARPEVRLYLRTEELAQSWASALTPALQHRPPGTLPSLEIPDEDLLPSTPAADGLRLGIIGQIRPGKGIEWLVPAFAAEPALGRLTVAGEFNRPETQSQLQVLDGYAGFERGYLSEADILARCAAQDYLLMLYEPWDPRMESAVVFLAARVGRPVIVYGNSWCGRMVREYGCGVVVPPERAACLQALRDLPRPGSAAYEALLSGMAAFRAAHSTAALRPRLVRELLG